MDIEILGSLNWLAILVAGVAYFVLGALWYSKILFVNPWIRYTGVNMNDPNAKKGVARIMITSVILMIVAAIGVAILEKLMGIINAMAGAKLGLIVGVCFSMTGMSISYLYEKRPLGLHLINAGYNIVGCIIAAVILSVWH